MCVLRGGGAECTTILDLCIARGARNGARAEHGARNANITYLVSILAMVIIRIAEPRVAAPRGRGHFQAGRDIPYRKAKHPRGVGVGSNRYGTVGKQRGRRGIVRVR